MSAPERLRTLRDALAPSGAVVLYAFGSRAGEVAAWLDGRVEHVGFGGSDLDLAVLPEADPFVAAEVVRGERLYAADSLGADEYELYGPATCSRWSESAPV